MKLMDVVKDGVRNTRTYRQGSHLKSFQYHPILSQVQEKKNNIY